MTKHNMPRRGVHGNDSVARAAVAIARAEPRIETFADDNEPRIRDEDLALRLGYARVENFRALIRQYDKKLRKISVLRGTRITTDPVKGGRPGWMYFLTEGQAVFLIGKAGTEDADDIFVEISRAFVEYRRAAFRADLYGAIMRELLLPAPRTWQPEYPESFWEVLHKVGGWQRPAGNNHSNCAHFINEFIYSYLLGALGLKALQDVNPANDAGARAYRHHQFLKEKHLDRLRQHIGIVEGILENSVSLKHFADQFARFFKVPHAQLGFLFEEEPA